VGAGDLTPGWDGEDVVLAERIFGTADPASVRGMIAAWCDARAYKARCEHALDSTRERWEGSSRQALDALSPCTAPALRA
jgi:hypothetical protein